jgi:putative nucleotidyltransferase with HDIG domain
MVNLKDIIRNSSSLEYRYTFVTEDDLRYIYATVQHILKKINKPFLSEYVFVIIKELLINSVRACAKRYYFIQNSYDINNPNQYEKGMEKFRDEIILSWSEKKEFLQDSHYFVKLNFNYDSSLKITITNNTPLLPQELKRIQTRLMAAEKYNSILDAFQDISDSQESAGLGIVMVILLLKSFGLSQKNLSIYTEDGNTISEVTIPEEIFSPEIHTQIKDKIIQAIHMLPSLPDSLKKIIDMCKSSSLDMIKLSQEIEKNPSLSADLLKLSNSTSFMTRTTVKNILQATKIVGSNNILNMLYAVSSYKMMKEKFPRMEKEWEHANKTSVFATQIAIDFGLNKVTEIIAVGGLLHDIGKIVLLSVEGEVFKQIQDLSKNRNLESTKSIEEASIGISHSELGTLLANKWNYPPELIAMIEFHQDPSLAPEEYKTLAEVVFLANIISNRLEQDQNLYVYDLEILEKYGIETIQKFSKYQQKLEKYYKENLKNSFI